MPICHKRKIAFCHIPRTGGVSIVVGLDMEVPDYHYKASWYRENYPDYYLFTTLRSYKDRESSAFGWDVPEYNYDELINAKYQKGQRNLGLMLRPNEYFLDVEVDCILRFEKLNSDLNKMLGRLGQSSVTLKPCNSFRK